MSIAGKYVHAKYTQIDNMVNDNHVYRLYIRIIWKTYTT